MEDNRGILNRIKSIKRSTYIFISSIFFLAVLLSLYLLMPPGINYILIVFNYIIVFFILKSLFYSNKSTSSKKLWMVIIIFFPFIGIIFYFFFGLDYTSINLYKTHSFYTQEELDNAELNHDVAQVSNIQKAAYRMSHKPVYKNTEITLLTNGDEKFPKLYEELRKAKKFIHFQYFIFHFGDVANNITEILIEKALAGVEIRILIDEIGASEFDGIYFEKMIKAGCQIRIYNPLKFSIFQSTANFRNHRKIVVIDGDKGFTGGINIGDEYNHQSKKYGHWRDTHIFLEGEAVRSLHAVFIEDWFFMTNENLLNEKYLEVKTNIKNNFEYQIIKDGPDSPEALIKDTYLKAIMDAKKKVYISTPYLVISEDLLAVLRIAALSGVEVIILVPGKPDKEYVYKATESFFEILLEAGVRIFKYGENFMHSKFLIVDDKFASVGTLNLDFRSFYLNFEVTALIYNNKKFINEIEKEYKNDLEFGYEIIYEEWLGRSKKQKSLEKLAILFSDLM